MYHPALVACLAVAASATAAELKDPAEVAREWDRTMTEAQIPASAQPGLLAQSVRPPTEFSSRPNQADPLPFQGRPRMPAPNRIAPQDRTETPPPGAKPWKYRDGQYWIVPLAT